MKKTLFVLFIGLLTVPSMSYATVCLGATQTKWGNGAPNTIYGTNGNDVIKGYGGDDRHDQNRLEESPKDKIQEHS